MTAPLSHHSEEMLGAAECIFFAPHEIAVGFFEQTKPLDDRQREWLHARGVSDAAMRGDPGLDTAELRAGCVAFDRRYFDFARRADEGARPAFVVIARDEFGIVDDMVAFDAHGRIGVWLGRAAMLGEQMVDFPRIESPALAVYPDAMAWLCAERRGVVILDAKRARWRLAGDRLAVDSVGFGRRLEKSLALPRPRIFVREAA